MKNLYLISQTVNNDYDTYDSAVVVAEYEEQARNIHPDGRHMNGNWLVGSLSDWTSPGNVQVELIGTCIQSIDDEKGFKVGTVICSSYNAG